MVDESMKLHPADSPRLAPPLPQEDAGEQPDYEMQLPAGADAQEYFKKYRQAVREKAEALRELNGAQTSFASAMAQAAEEIILAMHDCAQMEDDFRNSAPVTVEGLAALAPSTPP